MNHDDHVIPNENFFHLAAKPETFHSVSVSCGTHRLQRVWSRYLEILYIYSIHKRYIKKWNKCYQGVFAEPIYEFINTGNFKRIKEVTVKHENQQRSWTRKIAEELIK